MTSRRYSKDRLPTRSRRRSASTRSPTAARRRSRCWKRSRRPRAARRSRAIRRHRGRVPQHLELLLVAELEKPPTRARLQRALVSNAATKPVNVLVPVGVVVAGIAIQATWLIVFAVVVCGSRRDDVLRRGGGEAGSRSLLRPRPGARRPRPTGELARPIEPCEGSEGSRLGSNGHRGGGPAVRRSDGRGTPPDRGDERNRRSRQVVHDYLSQQEPDRVKRRIYELERSGEDETGRQTLEALRGQATAYDELRRSWTALRGDGAHRASLGAINAQIVRASVGGEHRKTARAREPVPGPGRGGRASEAMREA